MSIFVQGAASSKSGRGGVQEEDACTATHMNHMIVRERGRLGDMRQPKTKVTSDLATDEGRRNQAMWLF